MPTRAKKPCKFPMCPNLVKAGTQYCFKHKSMARKIDDRPSAGNRGYDRVWQKFRIWYLRRHPMCEEEGCGCIATVIHHIKALSDGGDRFGENNLKVLCTFHHNQQTARENKGFGNVPRGGG